MDNKSLENIDEFINASDLVRLLEEEKKKTEGKYYTLLREDGVPKRGKATAAATFSKQIDAINLVLKIIEKGFLSKKIWDKHMEKYVKENEIE